jgi:hypothetical protein
MHSAGSIFLGTLFPGLFLLIFGVYLTRRNWRSDVLPYTRQPRYVRACDVALHPARYCSPSAARTARIFNLAGALLLLVAVLAVFYGIALAIQLTASPTTLGPSPPALIP